LIKTDTLAVAGGCGPRSAAAGGRAVTAQAGRLRDAAIGRAAALIAHHAATANGQGHDHKRGTRTARKKGHDLAPFQKFNESHLVFKPMTQGPINLS
jgi:hypothetical protein